MVSCVPPRAVIGSLSTKADTKIKFFFFLNVAPGIVSCLTRWTATLSSATSITGAPVSQVYWTQQQCKMEDVVDVLGSDWISHYRKASPIEIRRRLRSVYGGDAMYVSSDAVSVLLRAVKRTLVTVVTWPTSWTATSGTVKESVSGILGQRCHNQFRATCADINL